MCWPMKLLPAPRIEKTSMPGKMFLLLPVERLAMLEGIMFRSKLQGVVGLRGRYNDGLEVEQKKTEMANCIDRTEREKGRFVTMGFALTEKCARHAGHAASHATGHDLFRLAETFLAVPGVKQKFSGACRDFSVSRANTPTAILAEEQSSPM